MKKKTLQAAVIALGILSASFTVSAMGETDVEDTALSEITEESMQNRMLRQKKIQSRKTRIIHNRRSRKTDGLKMKTVGSTKMRMEIC